MYSLSQERQCNILGKLSKDAKMTSDKNGFCVYVDTNEFPDDSEIPVKATINEGKPTDKLMYYEIIDTEPKYNNNYTLSLSQATDINFAGGITNPSTKYYKYISSYFKIPKLNKRFLIVSIPEFEGKNSEIEISKPFPKWAIITLIFVVGIALFITWITICVCCAKKIRKRLSHFFSLFSSENTALINPRKNETNYDTVPYPQ